MCLQRELNPGLSGPQADALTAEPNLPGLLLQLLRFCLSLTFDNLIIICLNVSFIGVLYFFNRIFLKISFVCLFVLSSPEDIFQFFVQIEREGERGRERERNIDVKGHIEGLPPARPTRAGDKLQPKYVPLAGTEPGSLWTAGRRFNR
uniref:Uncharacterized protein n=1 Tax=Molossus molossus TaxID=27622 RepID=A0A7J8GKE3_MOLMO|nr:hypothetical protein HJG59_011486 [Molossus molossus]